MNIKTKIQSLILGISLTLIASNIQAREVKNIYINGINNTERQAEISSDALSDAFYQLYGDVLANTDVIFAYNESEGGFFDLIESGLQKTDLDDVIEGLTAAGLLSASQRANIASKVNNFTQKQIMVRLIHRDLLLNNQSYRQSLYGSVQYVYSDPNNILLTGAGSLNLTDQQRQQLHEQVIQIDEFALLLDLGFTSIELGILKGISGGSVIYRDLSNKIGSLYQTYGYDRNQEYATQRFIRENYLDPVLSRSGGVNIIAHSQGNFFANEAVSDINQPADTRLLSVASPSGELPSTGSFVNLREDLVVRLTKPNLGWNYSNISSSKWNSFKVPLLYSSSPVVAASLFEGQLYSENTRLYGDGKGHNFVQAYLKPGTPARARILQKMSDNYRALGGNLVPTTTDNIYLKNPSIDMPVVKSGSEVRLRIKVCYTGDKTTSQLGVKPNVAYYISRNQGLSGATFLSEDSSRVGTDRPCDSESDRATIPTGLSPGQYYIVYDADWRDELVESHENDNLTYLPITVVSNQTMVDDITVSHSTVEKRGARDFYVTVRHNFSGTTVKGGFSGYPRVGYYLSKNTTWDRSDILLDDDSSSIHAGDTYDPERELLHIPSNVSRGYWYILFVADYTDVLPEVHDSAYNDSNQKDLKNVAFESIFVD